MYALSIDVGTTFTAAAVWRDGRASTITLGDHSDAIASVLFLREDDVFLIGEPAVRRALSDPSRVAREFKRRMGDDVPKILAGRRFTAPELTAHLIGWVLERAAQREGSAPGHVALTCPASWGTHRRAALQAAAGLAGLDSAGGTAVGLMPEPDAAATHYASLNRLAPGSTVAVYDLGGGTFDAAVLRKTSSGFELCGPPGGDDTIGGIDFDAVVMQQIGDQIADTVAQLDPDDPLVESALAQLKVNAVAAKEALSTDPSCQIPVLLPGTSRLVQLSRAAFEDGIRQQVVGTVDRLRQTIEAAGLTPSGLDGVLLVGGSSRIPLVAQLVRSELGMPILSDTHPKHSVCLGAAVAVAGRVDHGSRQVRRAEPVTSTGQVKTAQAEAAEPVALAGPATVLGNARGSGDRQLEVDLSAAGLTRPQDSPVPVEPTHSPRLRVTDRDEPLVARLDGPEPSRGLRLRVLLILLTAIVVLIAVIVIARLR